MTYRVVMLAAECAALPGMRRSALADSVNDLARSLCQAGNTVSVVTPAYGLMRAPDDATNVRTTFAGEQRDVVAWATPSKANEPTHVLLDHPLFSPHGAGRVYCDDTADSPFATDATKFAFFAAAAAQWISGLPDAPTVIHAHDWPAAMFFVVRAFNPDVIALKNIHSVFSLHSLAVQGVRPLALHPSSLRSWFPDLAISRRAVVDPTYPDCGNPVAAALRLADQVSVPGRHLLKDLKKRQDPLAKLCVTLKTHQRLVCIEPGAEPRQRPLKRPPWRPLGAQLAAHNLQCIGKTRQLRSAHYLAQRRLDELPNTAPRLVVNLPGPFDATHLALLRTPVGKAPSVLDALLDQLAGNERLIAVGHGDESGEAFMTEVAARQPRLLYLQGASAELGRALLAGAHFHLLVPDRATSHAAALPALNAGRPCLVQAVGALGQIIEHERNGWSIKPGASAPRSLVKTFGTACEAARARGGLWQSLMTQAASSGTAWTETAKTHMTTFYRRATP